MNILFETPSLLVLLGIPMVFGGVFAWLFRNVRFWKVALVASVASALAYTVYDSLTVGVSPFVAGLFLETCVLYTPICVVMFVVVKVLTSIIPARS